MTAAGAPVPGNPLVFGRAFSAIAEGGVGEVVLDIRPSLRDHVAELRNAEFRRAEYYRSLIAEAVSPIPDHVWVRPHPQPYKHIELCPGCLWYDRNREVWAELRAIAAGD